MALIIETGAGDNPLANSYQNVDDLRLYADARGVNLDQKNNKELEVALIKAMDYLEAQRDRYKGDKVSASQPLQWPRSDVYDVEQRGALMPNDEIPRLVQYAQLSLAIEALSQDLMPNPDKTEKGAVTKEKVGELEVTYSSPTINQDFVSALAKPNALLSPLYEQNGLSLVRG